MCHVCWEATRGFLQLKGKQHIPNSYASPLILLLTFSLPYMTEISFVNERNHKMTQIFVKYILHLCIFRHLKLEIALAIPASNDEK